MEVINTQWLYRSQAKKIKETSKTITVRHDKNIMQTFWKDTGLMVGFTKVLRIGCEPDKLVGL